MDYHSVSDEDLIERIHEGCNEAMDFLLSKYKSLVKIKSRSYFLLGSDRDDLIQEGMIGLYKAVRDYNANRAASFRSFAELCVTRQIISAVKTASRQKHMPLNAYMSLNYDSPAGEGRTFLEQLPGTVVSPEDLLLDREQKNYIEVQINKELSSFESTVLVLYLQGKSYAEISGATGSGSKSVDNALQRVRKKVEKILAKKEEEGLRRSRPMPQKPPADK